MESPWFGPVYAVVEAEGRGEDARQALRSYHIENPDGLEGRRVDSIINASQRYDILDGLLMKRVHDAEDNEVQLRIVAPEGHVGRMVVPGHATLELGVRERILLEYHNGRLGGHLGVDKTAARILKDWYWPGVMTT